MEQAAIMARLSGILVDTIGFTGPLEASMSTNDFAGWDSFGAMNIVTKIEEEFGIDIPAMRIPELNSIEKIVGFIAKKTEK